MFPHQLCSTITLEVPLIFTVALFFKKIELVNSNFASVASKLEYTTELTPELLINNDSVILFELLLLSAIYITSPFKSAVLLINVQLTISILFPLKYTAAPFVVVMAFLKIIFFKVKL